MTTTRTPSPKSILVVDDDVGITRLLTELLEEDGYAVTAVWSANEALEKVRHERFDLMITDLVLPDIRGNELLKRTHRLQPELPVILITAFGTMDFAVQVMREGATDFIAKPFTPNQLLMAVQRVWINHALEDGTLPAPSRPDELDGMLSDPPPKSASMRRIEILARRAAATDAHILITGESGTGKTRLAHQIHQHSNRSHGPFVVLNCGAIPSALMESELFGAVKGAFTDAKTDRKGLIQSASGGTLFLDEIADLPLQAQAKLLRVLETKVIRPIGAVRETAVDIRVMSATHQPLEQAVAEGRFRSDLYYRLHVIQLDLPSLCERAADIPDLVHGMLREMDAGSVYTVHPDAMAWLCRWRWPGNIRELSNRLQRAVALASSTVLMRHDLAPDVSDESTTPDGHLDATWTPQTLADLEQAHIERTLAYTQGNKAKAAALLGIDRRTLYRRLDRTSDDDEA